MIKAALVFLLALQVLSAEGIQKKCPLTQKKVDTPIWITVFIHGAVKAEWIFNSLLSVVTGSLEGSTYEKAISKIRHDPHFFRFHAMQELGLKKIELPSGPSELGAQAVAQLYDHITAESQPSPTINYYYTFGWSGLMSSDQRLHEAEQFYNELAHEINRISTLHHVTPRLRLIAYSHGGNVCLNLARAKMKTHDSCFTIDELILIGSPVQPETEHLITDPMFKRIYNIYSPDDMVQPYDIFSSKKSSRIFTSHGSFRLPDKLKQVCVKVAHYKPRHIKEDLPLPMPLDYRKSEVKKRLCNPGHIELWYMGWTASMYREKFPLHPFPIVDFVSYIINKINQEPTLKNNIIVTLNPQQEIMIVKSKQSHVKKTMPFLSLTKLEELKKIAAAYKPDETYYNDHRKRVAEALAFAKASKKGALVRIQKEDGSYYKISKAATCFQ